MPSDTTTLSLSTPSYSSTELQNDDPHLAIAVRLYDIVGSLVVPATPNGPLTSPISAAHQIDDLIPGKELDMGERDSDEIDKFQEEVWLVFIKVAEQVPWDHAGQDHLANALTALEALDGPELSSSEWMWHHLPLIRGHLEAASASRISANLEAFTARLCGRGLVDMPRCAIRSLREGLERFPWNRTPELMKFAKSRREIDEKTLRLISAAQWMIHAGACLHKHCKLRTLSEGQVGRLYGKVGGKWRGAIGFSTERWAFWRSAFVEISLTFTDDHLPGPVRAVASEAAAAMDLIQAM